MDWYISQNKIFSKKALFKETEASRVFPIAMIKFVK